jgi:hypothetical protein
MPNIERASNPWVSTTVSAATTLVLACSVALNVTLARRLSAAQGPSVPAHSLKGASVPPLHGTTLDGDPVAIDFQSDVPVVLYYFSTTCAWCERNLANVKALAGRSGQAFRLVGVSNSPDLDGYVADRALGIELVTAVPPPIVAAYRFAGTPHTLVVGKGGRVLEDWPGAYSGSLQQQIERYFRVPLPGLLPARTVASVRER